VVIEYNVYSFDSNYLDRLRSQMIPNK